MSDNTLQIWNWSDNTILFSMQGDFSYWTNPVFLSNGLLAASGSAGSTVNVWNISTGQLVFSLNAGYLALEELCTGYLATTGDDNLLSTWSITNGSLIDQVTVSGTQNALKQTPVNNYLASGSNNAKVYIWNITNLASVATLAGHTNGVYLLDTTQSGLLVSGSDDFSLILWNLTTFSLLDQLFALKTGWAQLLAISDNQLVFGDRDYNGVQLVDIISSTNLSLGAHITLPNNNFNNFRLNSQNVLLVANSDRSVNFLNLNTSMVMQTLTPPHSAQVMFMDIVGKLVEVF
jgi:WD40 repeat protein